MLRLCCAFVCLLAAAAHAEPDSAAYRLYADGLYEEAAETGAAISGAENLALAARSLNALAYLQEDDEGARRIAKEALEYAEAAMEADDALVEGHLQAAISLAQRGARMGALKAFFLGIAGRARDELDVSLAREPDNPWALSSSAAWHLEVARRAGEGRFGSDPELGFQQFMAARAADPENLLIAYECALRLIAFEKPEWRPQGLEALSDVLAMTPENAFERAIKTRAEEFRAAIAAGPEAERDFIEMQP